MYSNLFCDCTIKFSDRVPPVMACEDKICGKFIVINLLKCIKHFLSCHCSGGTFNAEVSNVERTVSSFIRPFRLAFHTDSVEAPNDVDNRGFCLDYVQQPCTNG